MDRQKPGRKKRLWAVIPPWLIIGAVAIIVPLFIFTTLENINRQREQTTRLLVEKGAALIRSFEAGARTGLGMRWGGFQLQKLLMETAQQPDIDYLIVTDVQGTDRGRQRSRADRLELRHSSSTWKRSPVRRRSPGDRSRTARGPTPSRYTGGLRRRAETFPGFPDATTAPPPERRTETPGFVIFVGLDMGPIIAAHEEDRRHTIWMAVIFLLIGCSGIVSLLLAQGYRTARSSLSRIKAFSDSLVENMPIGLVAVDRTGMLIAFNQTAETILGRRAGDVLGKTGGGDPPRRLPGDLPSSLPIERRIIEREIDCTGAEGRTIPLEVIATTLHEEDGAFLGSVILFPRHDGDAAPQAGDRQEPAARLPGKPCRRCRP